MTDTPTPQQHAELLANVKRELPRLITIQDRCRADVDSFVMYRYLHRSWKVFEAKSAIDQMLGIFLGIAPEGVPVDAIYSKAIKDALGREWSESTNQNWVAEVGPIIDTYWLMRYFVDECIRCGALEEAPNQWLPDGWAALLEIYAIRDL